MLGGCLKKSGISFSWKVQYCKIYPTSFLVFAFASGSNFITLSLDFLVDARLISNVDVTFMDGAARPVKLIFGGAGG